MYEYIFIHIDTYIFLQWALTNLILSVIPNVKIDLVVLVHKNSIEKRTSATVEFYLYRSY